jgi:hypothetical protein
LTPRRREPEAPGHSRIHDRPLAAHRRVLLPIAEHVRIAYPSAAGPDGGFGQASVFACSRNTLAKPTGLSACATLSKRPAAQGQSRPVPTGRARGGSIYSGASVPSHRADHGRAGDRQGLAGWSARVFQITNSPIREWSRDSLIHRRHVLPARPSPWVVCMAPASAHCRRPVTPDAAPIQKPSPSHSSVDQVAHPGPQQKSQETDWSLATAGA